MPGKRAFHTLPGYGKSTVRHAIYLPTDWIKAKSHRVIAEFNGNNSTVAGGGIDGADDVLPDMAAVVRLAGPGAAFHPAQASKQGATATARE